MSCVANAQESLPTDQAISYVFASELGSGVYSLSGRNLQVYRLSPSKELRGPDDHSPGVRLIMPITTGFLNFSPVDVIEGGLPRGIDSFSITPGVELDFALRDDWHLMPYVDVGTGVARGGSDGWLYGAGIRLERTRPFGAAMLETRNELTFAGVTWHRDLPDERYIRLRQAAEMKRGLGWWHNEHELEGGLYAIVDYIIDSPVPPIAGSHREPLQLEAGFTVGTRPAYRVWRFDLPGLGFGYRFAGSLSGWRVVIGETF
jgi:hypothetical protein